MVKVRFAPSPTGDLHIGNAWTALLNFAFALKHNGQLILRIEDTDRERSHRFYETSIIDDLKWLGIKYDQGPIRQSERFEIYKEFARVLLRKGYAYKCFCRKEEIEKAREEALKKGLAFRYSEKCRNLSFFNLKRLERLKIPYVIRFKSFKDKITFKDEIKGEVTFPKDHVDDFILLKEDLTPTYNFAATVDDMLMGITHVIRGADHLSNTPKQIMVFLAFDSKTPSYAHHPLLLGPDKKPLSKRHGVTKIKELREMGFLKEAILNYLFLIGQPKREEIVPFERLVEEFSLSSLSSSDAHFDIERLLWFNKQYIRRLSPKEIALKIGLPQEVEKIELLRENAKTLNEFSSLIEMFTTDSIEERALSFLDSIERVEEILQIVEEKVKGGEKDPEELVKMLKEITGLERNKLFLLLRIIFTGRLTGPPLKDIARIVKAPIIESRISCLKRRFLADSH